MVFNASFLCSNYQLAADTMSKCTLGLSENFFYNFPISQSVKQKMMFHHHQRPYFTQTAYRLLNQIITKILQTPDLSYISKERHFWSKNKTVIFRSGFKWSGHQGCTSFENVTVTEWMSLKGNGGMWLYEARCELS